MNDLSIQGERVPREAAAQATKDQIVEAANAHFSHYGYAKTTMADLAREIGFSKAYLYRFFESKQAIGEAVCSACLGRQQVAIRAAVDAARTTQEKLRALFKTSMKQSLEQLFSDAKLYDIVTYAISEKWRSADLHCEQLLEMLKDIIVSGREAGEFERKTPLDELCSSIWWAMSPFVSPVMLQFHLDHAEEGVTEVANLVLRSLAP